MKKKSKKQLSSAPLTKREFLASQRGTDGRINKMDKRFDGIDDRLDGVDKRLDGIDNRLDGVDKRLDGIDNRLDDLTVEVKANTKGLARAEVLMEAIDHKLDLALEMLDPLMQKSTDHEKRITALEAVSPPSKARQRP